MFAVGAVWFTVLFGRLWSDLMKRTPEEIEKVKQQGMSKQMFVMFLLNVVAASVFFYLVPQLLALTLLDYLVSLLIIWLGFSLPVFVNAYLWEGKPMKLVFINIGGSLAALIAGGATVFLLQ